jgi:hypothetical protein
MIQAPGEREIAGKSLSTLLANLGNTAVEHLSRHPKVTGSSLPKIGIESEKIWNKIIIFDQTLLT